MASVTFAVDQATVRAQCGQSCCEQYSGTWTGSDCVGYNSANSYSTCVDTCTQVATQELSCCGGGFVLLAVALGFVCIRN